MAKPSITSTTGSQQGTNSTSYSMTMPATRPDDDLYICVIGKDSNPGINDHASWTKIYSTADEGTPDDAALYVGYRIGSSEPASYTITADSEEWSGAVIRISAGEFDPADPIDVSASTAGGNSTTVVCPDVTPTVTDGLVIRCGAVDTDLFDAAMSGTGHTDLYDSSSSGGGSGSLSIGISTMDAGTTASVAVGTSVLNINGTDEWNAVTLVVAPAIAGPIITSIDTDDDTVDTRDPVLVAGSAFGATDTGSAKVEITDHATYGSGSFEIEVPRNSWSATSISIALEESGTGNPLDDDFTLPGTHYVFVTDSSGTRNATGFPFTLKPAGATWLENADTATDVDVTSGNVKLRGRIEVDFTGSASSDVLEYRYSHNGGAYTDLTGASSVIKTVASANPYFVDSADVTEQLIGSGTYQSDNNAAVEATDGTFTLGTVAAGSFETEIMLEVISADVADNDTIDLRLYESDNTSFVTAGGAYTQTPRITITKSGGGGANPHQPLGHPFIGALGGPI